MVRWLAFLFWIFSFSTWKAFFDRLLREARSRHGGEEQGSSSTNPALLSKVDETDASLEHGSILTDLAKLLLEISLNEMVFIDFDKDKEYEHEALACDKDAYVERILAAITTSTTLKDLKLIHVYPIPYDRILKSLLSNKSVKYLVIFSTFNDDEEDFIDMVYGEVSELLMQNMCIEDVVCYVRILGNKCAAAISNMLRHNWTLKRLSLGRLSLDEEGWKVFLDPLSGGNGSNFVLEHLSFGVMRGCTAGAHTCHMVQIGNMLHNNISLLSFFVAVNKDGAACAISSIGEALHFNKHLLCLSISSYGGKFPRDGLKRLFTSLVPDAQGRQANTSLRELFLPYMGNTNDEEMSVNSLCDMLRCNTSLVKLHLRYALRYSHHVIKVLGSLKSNMCLEALDLSGCEGVKGRRVLGAFLDLLDENHFLKEIALDGTSLEDDGSVQLVKATLGKRAKERLWEVVQGMATTTPTSARVFLCGDPYAGKTTLRKTIVENHLSASQKNLRRRKVSTFFTAMKVVMRPASAKDFEERTRGIEVHSIQCDDITMTIWDMAGQEEYHAFHDLVVPNLQMSGSCCSFVLVCNLAYHEDNPHHLKKIEEIIMELQYWLKFIVSNTRISNLYRPHVIVVFTHMDECSWDTRPLLQITKDLKRKFEEFVEFEDDDFVINSKTFKDSVDGVFNAMVNHLRGLLARVPKTIEACNKLQEIIKKRIEDNPHELIVEWEVFSKICDDVPELQMMDASDPNLIKRRKEFAASSLHDRGHVIYHEDLNMVIMNPHLFCHGIMGELMNGEKVSKFKPNVQHSISKGDLQMALSSTPLAKQHKVALADVLQVMQKLELCYEQEDGSIMIPSILSHGYRKLSWPMETKLSKYNYIGRRLTIDDKEKTLLSLGFFPRLQVSLRKEYGRACDIMKNMIKFIDNQGMEVIIEYKGYPAFNIDLMMRWNGNEDMILMDSLQRHLVKRIVTLCAHPTLGCPGVKLVEYIIRPSCVEELVAFQHKSEHQVVMVEKLKQLVLGHADLGLKYPWPSEGVVLKMGCDDAKTLLGPKMSNDMLNQLMVDLKSIERRILQVEGSTDTSCGARFMGTVKASKPSHVTLDDISMKIDNFQEKTTQRFDELEEKMTKRFDQLEEKMQDIKLLQEKLLPRVCRRLEELVTFTVEFHQHKYPRLPYLTECQDCGLTRMVPGMSKYILHLLCEHKDGFHFVEDQEGCELSIGTESTQAFQSAVKWGLRVMTILLKVGAHVGAGMGPMVPDLGRGFLLVLDTPGIGLDAVNMNITQTSMDEVKPRELRIEENAAQEWLIDVLKDKGSSEMRRLFKLRKVRYKMEEDVEGGCVAWICNKHYEEGRKSDTLELLPSYV